MTTVVLVVAATAIAGAIAGLLLVSVLRRVVRSATQSGRKRRYARAEPLLIAIAEGHRVPTGIGRRTERETEHQALLGLGTLRGEAADSMIGYLRARGVVDRSRARLRRPGAVGRARAAERLGTLRATDSAPMLVAALTDRSAEVRWVAARALGKIGGAGSAVALLGALDGHRRLPAGQVAAAIAAIGPEATPALRAAARDGHPIARLVALRLLGHLEALDAATDLEHVLFAERVPAIRIEAARALGRMGSPSSTAALVGACAATEDPRVRATAAAALGNIGATVAIGRLTEMITEDGHAVPHAAAGSLAVLGVEGRVRLVAAVAAGGSAADHAAEALAHHEIRSTARRAAVGRRSAR